MIVRGNKTPRRTTGNGAAGFSAAPEYVLTAAQRAAIEKSLSPYYQLECGHYVTKEVATLYSVFGSSIRDVFCENCDAYQRIKVTTKDASYPIHPLFLGYTRGNTSLKNYERAEGMG